jgi:16S rRNA (cytosine1402-N4)-methyltransferase
LSGAGENFAASAASAAHRPVLLSEVIDALQPRDGAIYVDGTFGAGGYSRALLDAARCAVWGIDRDPGAIEGGKRLAAQYGGRLALIEGCYGDRDTLLAERGVDAVDGIALDLGVSSMQLDQPERGFSFRGDGPLDMRMSRSGASAADIVNRAEESELADIIFKYGEERHARRIARAIVAARALAPIERTAQLANIVARVVGRGDGRIHPATRTFQALRIAVNDELGELERGLNAGERMLRAGGRFAVVSFHSLEDRIVKDFMRRRAGDVPRPSRHVPSVAAAPAATLRLINRKPIVPGEQEASANPRARSARLRVAEAIGAPAAGGAA